MMTLDDRIVLDILEEFYQNPDIAKNTLERLKNTTSYQ